MSACGRDSRGPYTFRRFTTAISSTFESSSKPANQSSYSPVVATDHIGPSIASGLYPVNSLQAIPDGGPVSEPDLPGRRLAESWLGLSRVNDRAAAPAADLPAGADGFPNPGPIPDPPHGPGVRLWNRQHRPLARLAPHPAPVTAVALSPDGRLLAVGDTKGRVKVLRLPEQLRPVSQGDRMWPDGSHPEAVTRCGAGVPPAL